MGDVDVSEWDAAKADSNVSRHGVAFEQVRLFDFDAAVIVEDARNAYGETRWEATGPIGPRIHVLVYTMRGLTVRVISLRKANLREVRRYESQI